MKCELCDNKADSVYIVPTSNAGINICNHCEQQSENNWVSYPIS